MSFVVAIDGPAAAGKGTISAAVARHFGFSHLDTGLLYRAVAKKVLDEKGEFDLELAKKYARHLTVKDLLSENLRTAKIAKMASKIGAIPAVRTALVDYQRNFSTCESGAVLDGRDIGTVICPNANVKLFITASATVRAERRFLELKHKGETLTRKTVLADIVTRDSRDAGRADAPMIKAKDAVLIDTSDLSVDAAIEVAIQIISQIISQNIPK